MGLVAGPISANSLMEKLANAKKLMNKVDSGDFERGHIDESLLIDNSVNVNAEDVMLEDYSGESKTPSTNLLRPVSAPPDATKINQTKLPPEIKRAMMERPITVPNISLTDSVDMNIFAGAKRLIEQENKDKRPNKSQSFTSQKSQPPKQIIEVNNSDLLQSLIPIIESTIRKVLDEKLTQLLGVQRTQSINENLVLKVGDSIFQGKITGVKKAK